MLNLIYRLAGVNGMFAQTLWVRSAYSKLYLHQNNDHLIGSNFIKRRSPSVIFVYKIKLKSHQKVFFLFFRTASSPLADRIKFQLSAKPLFIRLCAPRRFSPLWLALPWFAFQLSSISRSSGFASSTSPHPVRLTAPICRLQLRKPTSSAYPQPTLIYPTPLVGGGL